MGLPSYPLRAQIIRHDPENDGMWVMLPSAVVPILIRRLYPHADGMRVHKPPLPVLGSWGLVEFPGGDVRNGFWKGAYHPNLVDALPSDPADPYSNYESRYDGGWSYTNGMSGHHAQQWADNSSFVMGSGDLAIPIVHRHIVTSGQARQRIPYTQQDRNPQPQQPFGVKHSQAVSGGIGGIVTTMSPSGSFNMTSTVSGQTWSVKPWNGTTVNIDASGNVQITLTTGVQVHITSQEVLITGDLHVTGAVIAGWQTGDQVGLQTHKHPQDPDSDGDTEADTQKPKPGT